MICLDAQTYTIQYASTPSGIRTSDIISGFKQQLKAMKITNAFSVGLGNLYAVTFYSALTPDQKNKLQAVATSVSNGEAVSDITDYNECDQGKQSCYNGLKCVNTLFSFRCGCTDGFELKDGQCVQGKFKLTFVIKIFFCVAMLIKLRNRRFHTEERSAWWRLIIMQSSSTK